MVHNVFSYTVNHDLNAFISNGDEYGRNIKLEANARNSFAKYFIIIFKIDKQENKKYIIWRFIKMRLKINSMSIILTC